MVAIGVAGAGAIVAGAVVVALLQYQQTSLGRSRRLTWLLVPELVTLYPLPLFPDILL